MNNILRRAAAEGCVLLKNDGTLPLRKGQTAAFFGRTAWDYIASGTGSGGLVHPPYKTNIISGLDKSGRVTIEPGMRALYEEWLAEHPFDAGHGWATEPWFQAEFVPDEDDIAKSAKVTDTAVLVIGRLSGEDRDNSREAGSWYLTDDERELLSRVKKHFRHTAVVLNTGNIIDMTPFEDAGALLCVWQGGQEGGDAAADVLTGIVSPSGKLPDTVARSIEDYPSDRNFGGSDIDTFEEDIYVGYRYFETFDKERVLYPFGFGLSYTSFEYETLSAGKKDEIVSFSVCVKNTGELSGREVIEIYAECPQGRLGAPARKLCAFAKTKELAPGVSETLAIDVKLSDIASYDDSGVTGYKSCFLLEAGEYTFYVGGDVRSAVPAFSFTLDDAIVTEKCTEALSPIAEFSRMKPSKKAGGGYEITYESVPTRSYDLSARIHARQNPKAEYAGERKYKFDDIEAGNCTVDEFVSGLSDFEICCLLRGEGLGSPKVDIWTTAVFGGITESLSAAGIPISTNSDGPSGIRSDAGAMATLAPNGTLLASTFDTDMTKEVMSVIGGELEPHGLDALLGPGMNIHRHPLCGRNFEYFSEDPYLTGKIAAAFCRGVSAFGGAATPKHFAANGRETRRFECNAVMSERAAREIYLRGFEILIRECDVRSIMTSYNLINGIHATSNYDLLTVILRGEWGYGGFVMTDWGAHMNADESSPSGCYNTAEMVRAGGDIYMVTPDTEKYEDNMQSALDAGLLTRDDIAAAAGRLIDFILTARKNKKS